MERSAATTGPPAVIMPIADFLLDLFRPTGPYPVATGAGVGHPGTSPLAARSARADHLELAQRGASG